MPNQPKFKCVSILLIKFSMLKFSSSLTLGKQFRCMLDCLVSLCNDVAICMILHVFIFLVAASCTQMSFYTEFIEVFINLNLFFDSSIEGKLPKNGE